MSNLTNLTITEALTGLENKDFSSVELTQAHLDAMEQARNLNIFITETPELALEHAQRSDDNRSQNKTGRLEGIPLAIKDIFCTKNVKTTAASGILYNFVPPYESTVTQNLLDDGAVFLGKANMDDAAMGTSNEHSHFGPVVSPWKRQGDDTDLVPGGSSGGSAAAVAARLAMGSTGTDTGGSIRQPASLSGVVGMKATYGRCSRWGIIAFASSLDQAGVMTRTVEDCALMMESISGHDPKDSTSVDIDVPDYSSLLTSDIKGMKIGIPKEYRVDGMQDDIVKNWEKGAELLKEAGAEIIDISLPYTDQAITTYYIINPAEASSNLARYDGVRYGLRKDDGDLKDLNDLYEKTRGAGFGKEVQRRILIGTYVLSAGFYDAYYIKAQKVRRLIKNDFDQAFEKCDVILTPTSPSAAFGIGEKANDPLALYLEDVLTVPVNLAGLPGLSVPTGLNHEGLPLGLQIIGKAFDEATVLRVGQVLQQQANFTAQPQLLTAQKAA